MEEASERYDVAVAFLRKAWTSKTRFSHHGGRWDFEDIVVEPAPIQKPHPPLWIGAFSPGSIRQAAESGCNLLLGQNGSPELVAESIGIYSKAVEAQDRTYDPMAVGLTRALHIAMNEEEREAAHRVRIQFTRNVQQLSLSPAGNSPNLGRPRRAVSEEEMRRATESDALIGTPQEIVERLRRLQAGGVEYVLIIDVGGSLAALRTFAREVMPEFAE